MIETERLILRAFIEADREPWAEMNADPEVMRHFPATLSRPEADAVIERVAAIPRVAPVGVVTRRCLADRFTDDFFR